ncbi:MULTISPECIES: YlcI/YnfO family protein [Xenorhabdus]|uniref:Phage protein n=1 Tax=Xenorhabdus yunnanensis TaxID=3025878 RepID=A0ABT5LJC7_9GAMM|nr:MULTISPECIES: YlcI/YnfO family protein [Xenorhabdus]MDC9591222.1 hypothetical protein [Xenorhabdus yunnanensis]
MATADVNNKSQKLVARVPHEVVELMEMTREAGESTGKYIVAAIKTEAKRRQRKAKASSEQ